jgi:hypothetical protein
MCIYFVPLPNPAFPHFIRADPLQGPLERVDPENQQRYVKCIRYASGT